MKAHSRNTRNMPSVIDWRFLVALAILVPALARVTPQLHAGTFEDLDMSAISSCTLDKTEFDLSSGGSSEVSVGDIIVFQTDMGHYGKLRIEALGSPLVMDVVTYNARGMEIVMEDDLELHTTWTLDLDSAISGPASGADMWYNVVSFPDNCHLKVESGASFALYKESGPVILSSNLTGTWIETQNSAGALAIFDRMVIYPEGKNLTLWMVANGAPVNLLLNNNGGSPLTSHNGNYYTELSTDTGPHELEITVQQTLDGTLLQVSDTYQPEDSLSPEHYSYTFAHQSADYFIVAPLHASVNENAQEIAFHIFTNKAWTAKEDVSWLEFISAPSGTGDGTLVASLSANPHKFVRLEELTIGSETVLVEQASSVSPPPASMSINPASLIAPPEGGSGTIQVTSSGPWTASESLDWVAITMMNTNGNGSVNYVIDANLTATDRSGEVTIGTETLTIHQDGQLANTTIDPDTADFSAAGGSITVNISSNTSWTATELEDWIEVIAPASGTGDGFVIIQVEANLHNSTRSGIVQIANNVLYINQAEYQEPVTLDHTLNRFGVGGGSGEVNVSCNGKWTASTTAPWIHITEGATGNGNGMVRYTVDANDSLFLEPRSAVIVIGDKEHTVEQIITLAQPGVVGNVQATDGDYEDKIVVTWDSVKGADSYVLQRSEDEAFAEADIKEFNIGDVVSYEDTAVTPGKAYFYRVFTDTALGFSDPSDADSGYADAVIHEGPGDDPDPDDPGEGEAPAAVSGLHDSEWFGHIYDGQAPKMWTGELGWMHCENDDPASAMFYSYDVSDLGWFWTSEDAYPWVWVFSFNDWFYYYDGTGNGSGGWFTNASTGEMVWLGE